MKEKVCCVLDENEKYAVRLTNYINESHTLPYQAMAFSSEDALAGCTGRYDIEFILSDREINPEKVDTKGIPLCLRLVENDGSGENEVYRFQSAEHILQDVVSHLSGFSRSFQTEEGTTLIAVYSPATKCFKTTLSLALAVAGGEKGRTLWIGFEQFAGLSGVLPATRGGLSEALYYYHVGGENAYGKIAGCMDSAYGFDYLAPVECADDIADIGTGDMLKFIDMVGRQGAYSYIIADAGCVFNRPWELLEASAKIIMPQPLDYMGKRKEEDFEKYMHMSGRSKIVNGTVKAEVPYNQSIAGYEIQPSHFTGPEITDCARRYLNG